MSGGYKGLSDAALRQLVAQLEHDLYRGEHVDMGDYDYDHAGMWFWRPDSEAIQAAERALEEIQSSTSCSATLKAEIDQIVSRARLAQQDESAGGFRHGTVTISSAKVSYQDVIPHRFSPSQHSGLSRRERVAVGLLLPVTGATLAAAAYWIAVWINAWDPLSGWWPVPTWLQWATAVLAVAFCAVCGLDASAEDAVDVVDWLVAMLRAGAWALLATLLWNLLAGAYVGLPLASWVSVGLVVASSVGVVVSPLLDSLA